MPESPGLTDILKLPPQMDSFIGEGYNFSKIRYLSRLMGIEDLMLSEDEAAKANDLDILARKGFSKITGLKEKSKDKADEKKDKSDSDITYDDAIRSLMALRAGVYIGIDEEMRAGFCRASLMMESGGKHLLPMTAPKILPVKMRLTPQQVSPQFKTYRNLVDGNIRKYLALKESLGFTAEDWKETLERGVKYFRAYTGLMRLPSVGTTGLRHYAAERRERANDKVTQISADKKVNDAVAIIAATEDYPREAVCYLQLAIDPNGAVDFLRRVAGYFEGKGSGKGADVHPWKSREAGNLVNENFYLYMLASRFLVG